MAKNARTSETDESVSSAAESAADTTRESLAQVAQSASTMLHRAEAFQQVQLQMLQRVALAHQQAADKLRAATSSAEMLALQGQLFYQGWQEAVRYGQDLVLAAIKLQSDMLGKVGERQQAARDNAPVTFQEWQHVMLDALSGAGSRQH